MTPERYIIHHVDSENEWYELKQVDDMNIIYKSSPYFVGYRDNLLYLCVDVTIGYNCYEMSVDDMVAFGLDRNELNIKLRELRLNELL